MFWIIFSVVAVIVLWLVYLICFGHLVRGSLKRREQNKPWSIRVTPYVGYVVGTIGKARMLHFYAVRNNESVNIATVDLDSENASYNVIEARAKTEEVVSTMNSYLDTKPKRRGIRGRK